MSRAHILVIEDEAPIADILVQALKRSGYEASWAGDGDTGLELIMTGRPDLVLLDLMLPGLEGWEVCRRMRQAPETRDTPVIMVTARRDESEAVAGLAAGADDYIRKPFSLAELMARVEAQLRRRSMARQDAEETKDERIVLDQETGVVRIDGWEAELSPTEFQILELLASRPGRPVSRDRITAVVWGLDPAESRALDTHLSRLRKKLSGCPDGPEITTLRSRGYRLEWRGSANEAKP
ncbi:response regulator with CheY-like receiver domain and winged-helix DNA-binding domain [Jonquetella anthropi DSM 22815]|uniref:Response regulator with CheY-like receiver domain and winged-helix DNA-binding domain n=1 Tax=Jonquetella anthropi DSM 22815 TaxID=885272 RepID=H0UIV5_9BACT|nr:response regulator transcription factor [Jonquetella anthropi]EEX48978.1 response regulator receiver domain protein [Jonquetella anthropi E3_33 E1]EHM12749.1 response regulator with CheY-like receiver domain and winged-helix DNA-binding domain [Jonquetella anthropi DSM 22815]